MSWSYDTNLTAAKDQVRFYSSDTDSAAAITLTDEEIAGAILLGGNVRAAAALCCETLAGRYASFGQRIVDDLGQTVDYGARATFFEGRAAQLRSRISLSAIPFAGAQCLGQANPGSGYRPRRTGIHQEPARGSRAADQRRSDREAIDGLPEQRAKRGHSRGRCVTQHRG
jgi:hypothetical protein